jgi:tetratricopeptide (TPR) repeat protein
MNLNVDWCLGEAQRHLRDWRFTAARELLAEVLRADPPEPARLAARLMLAEIRRELGDAAGALAEASSVAARRFALHGPRDPGTVEALALVGAAHHDLGRLDQAEATYYQRVLEGGLDEDGPAGRAIRRTRANLALLRRDRGDLRSATTMLDAAYVAFRRAYGRDDLDTVRMAAELADLRRAAGDVRAARRLLAVAHAGARARVGDGHPLTEALDLALTRLEAPALPVDDPRCAPICGRRTDRPPPHRSAQPQRADRAQRSRPWSCWCCSAARSSAGR